MSLNYRTGSVATWPFRYHSTKACVLRNGQVATASCSAVECHHPDGSILIKTRLAFGLHYNWIHDLWPLRIYDR